MDWTAVFAVQVPALELVLRGTAMYWFLFLLFRFVLRRDVGQIGVADVLLLVLIADASQNGMSGGYSTVTEGFILVATIAGWSYLLDWLSFRSAAIAKFTDPPLLPLVRHGRILHSNLRRENLTEAELMSQLREQGIASLQEVQHAFLEATGRISVLRAAKPRDGR